MVSWIDLTHPLGCNTLIYRDGSYSDPPYSAKKWAEIDREGFEVWQLGLATQMGTHIDAPCHFLLGGATLDDLNPDDMIGTYRFVSAGELAGKDFSIEWAKETHLFLDARTTDEVSISAVRSLLTLPIRIVVMAGELKVDHCDPFWFHRELAASNKFLVEDLCIGHHFIPKQHGRIVTCPLRLTGLSGSPARVLVEA